MFIVCKQKWKKVIPSLYKVFKKVYMAQSNLFYGYYAVFVVVGSVYVLKSMKHAQKYNDFLRIILFVLCLYILCVIAYFVLVECVSILCVMSMYDQLFCVQWVSTLIS